MCKKYIFQNQFITCATMLTALRIVLTPFIVWAIARNAWHLAFALFIAAALSDLFDGLVARAMNQQTTFGASLDPVADKLFLLSIFFTLALVQTGELAIPLWFVLLIAIKELCIIGGACFLLCTGTPLLVRPTWLGKMSTHVQIIFIIWLFLCHFLNWFPLNAFYAGLFIVSLFIIGSFMQYASIGIRAFVGSHHEND